MLEEDYAAYQKTLGAQDYGLDSRKDSGMTEQTKQIIRDVIIPIIEQEVNEGENFANLRQIYNAMLLSVWFKKRLKDHILGQAYADKEQINSIALNQHGEIEGIWNQYVEAFKVGVYNTIKEDYDPQTQTVVPRKYFSGGAEALTDLGSLDTSKAKDLAQEWQHGVRVPVIMRSGDQAMMIETLMSFSESYPDFQQRVEGADSVVRTIWERFPYIHSGHLRRILQFAIENAVTHGSYNVNKHAEDIDVEVQIDHGSRNVYIRVINNLYTESLYEPIRNKIFDRNSVYEVDDNLRDKDRGFFGDAISMMLESLGAILEDDVETTELPTMSWSEVDGENDQKSVVFELKIPMVNVQENAEVASASESGDRAMMAKSDSEPQLKKNNVYQKSLNNLLYGNIVTEESKKRRAVLKKLGPAIEQYMRDYLQSPQLRIAIVPLGSTLKGYSSKESDIEYKILILKGIDEDRDLSAAEISDIIDKFNEYIEQEGYEGDSQVTKAAVGIDNFVQFEAGSFTKYDLGSQALVPYIFLPIMYGPGRLVENIRSNIVNVSNEKLWQEMRKQHYDVYIAIDWSGKYPELKPHLREWLRQQEFDFSQDEDVQRFNEARRRTCQLPSLSGMKQAYTNRAMMTAGQQLKATKIWEAFPADRTEFKLVRDYPDAFKILLADTYSDDEMLDYIDLLLGEHQESKEKLYQQLNTVFTGYLESQGVLNSQIKVKLWSSMLEVLNAKTFVSKGPKVTKYNSYIHSLAKVQTPYFSIQELMKYLIFLEKEQELGRLLIWLDEVRSSQRKAAVKALIKTEKSVPVLVRRQGNRAVFEERSLEYGDSENFVNDEDFELPDLKNFSKDLQLATLRTIIEKDPLDALKVDRKEDLLARLDNIAGNPDSNWRDLSVLKWSLAADYDTRESSTMIRILAWAMDEVLLQKQHKSLKTFLQERQKQAELEKQQKLADAQRRLEQREADATQEIGLEERGNILAFENSVVLTDNVRRKILVRYFADKNLLSFEVTGNMTVDQLERLFFAGSRTVRAQGNLDDLMNVYRGYVASVRQLARNGHTDPEKKNLLINVFLRNWTQFADKAFNSLPGIPTAGQRRSFLEQLSLDALKQKYDNNPLISRFETADAWFKNMQDAAKYYDQPVISELEEQNQPQDIDGLQRLLIRHVMKNYDKVMSWPVSRYIFNPNSATGHFELYIQGKYQNSDQIKKLLGMDSWEAFLRLRYGLGSNNRAMMNKTHYRMALVEWLEKYDSNIDAYRWSLNKLKKKVKKLGGNVAAIFRMVEWEQDGGSEDLQEYYIDSLPNPFGVTYKPAQEIDIINWRYVQLLLRRLIRSMTKEEILEKGKNYREDSYYQAEAILDYLLAGADAKDRAEFQPVITLSDLIGLLEFAAKQGGVNISGIFDQAIDDVSHRFDEEDVDWAMMGGSQKKKQTQGGVNLRSDQADIQIQTSENGFKFPKFDPAMLNGSLSDMVPVILQIAPMPKAEVMFRLGLAASSDNETKISIPSEKAKEPEVSAL